MAARRPSKIDLGLNPLAIGCLIAQAAILLFTIALYHIYSLSIVFDRETLFTGSVAGIGLVVWVSFFIVPGRQRGWATGEAAFAFLMVNLIASIVAPAQYGALAVGRPFVDQALARTDEAFGIKVSSLLSWAEQHPKILAALMTAYGTFGLQVLFAVPVLRVLRERQAMWEFVFHFHFCLIVALLVSVLWPVAGPYQWYGYTSPRDLARVITQVNGFHDGSLTVVRWAELDGLISNPSFHTAAGLFVIWATRTRWWLLAPMIVVNSFLILATFVTGIHYLVDTVAGGLLFALSLITYRVAKHRHFLRDGRPPEATGSAQKPSAILLDDCAQERVFD